MSDLEQRLARLEQRLAALETIVRSSAPKAPSEPTPRPPGPPAGKLAQTMAGPSPFAGGLPPMPAKPNATYAPRVSPESDTSLVTTVLGWGGAAALVLAASYLIKLVYDSGWLTPERQIAFATLFGIALVVAGFPLRRYDRRYAGYLPAGGVAVLFLTIYGAHLYHHLISAQAAMAAVVAVCVMSLWLCREFESDLYALFAVAGSYSAPILLRQSGGNVMDLAIYFSAWSIVFSAFSIWQGRRMIYLLALYLALLGFDVAWFSTPRLEWVAAIVFQCVQFLIFGVAVAQYSIRRDSPLTMPEAAAHVPPMLLFYFLQYALLDRHLHNWAPWIAVGTATALLAIYLVSRNVLKRPLPGGEFLLWAYVAVVLFHAGYIEAVPDDWAPWVGVGVLALAAVAAWRFASEEALSRQWPIWAAAAIIIVGNYLRVIFELSLHRVPGGDYLALVYAAQLYVAYRFASQKTKGALPAALIYGGHVSMMAAAVRLQSEHIVQSTAWGMVAVISLVVALQRRDKVLGQSSLMLFGAAALKVLFYDLSDAQPMWRITSLVLLGVMFYVGGMLYQKMTRELQAAGAS